MSKHPMIGSAVANELIRADRAFTGFELAELYANDGDFADFMFHLDGIRVLHHDDGPLVISECGCIEHVVTLFVETMRPVIIDGQFCAASSQLVVDELVASTRESLGYNNAAVDQEYGIFAISCLPPEVDQQVCSGIWQQLRNNGVVLDAELRYALTNATINEQIAGVVEMAERIDLSKVELPGEADGRSVHYFCVGSRINQFSRRPSNVLIG